MATTTVKLYFSPCSIMDYMSYQSFRNSKRNSKFRFRWMVNSFPNNSNIIDILFGKFGIMMCFSSASIKKPMTSSTEFFPVRTNTEILMAYIGILCNGITTLFTYVFSWVCSIQPRMKTAISNLFFPIRMFSSNPFGHIFNTVFGLSPMPRNKTSRLSLDMSFDFIGLLRNWRRITTTTFTKFHNKSMH